MVTFYRSLLELFGHQWQWQQGSLSFSFDLSMSMSSSTLMPQATPVPPTWNPTTAKSPSTEPATEPYTEIENLSSYDPSSSPLSEVLPDALKAGKDVDMDRTSDTNHKLLGPMFGILAVAAVAVVAALVVRHYKTAARHVSDHSHSDASSTLSFQMIAESSGAMQAEI